MTQRVGGLDSARAHCCFEALILVVPSVQQLVQNLLKKRAVFRTAGCTAGDGTTSSPNSSAVEFAGGTQALCERKDEHCSPQQATQLDRCAGGTHTSFERQDQHKRNRGTELWRGGPGGTVARRSELDRTSKARAARSPSGRGRTCKRPASPSLRSKKAEAPRARAHPAQRRSSLRSGCASAAEAQSGQQVDSGTAGGQADGEEFGQTHGPPRRRHAFKCKRSSPPQRRAGLSVAAGGAHSAAEAQSRMGRRIATESRRILKKATATRLAAERKALKREAALRKRADKKAASRLLSLQAVLAFMAVAALVRAQFRNAVVNMCRCFRLFLTVFVFMLPWFG